MAVATLPVSSTATGGFNFDFNDAFGKAIDGGLSYLSLLGQAEIAGAVAQQTAETNAFIAALNAEQNGQNAVSQQTQGANGSTATVWKPWMTYTAVGLGVLLTVAVVAKAFN